jgi:hypothetical protein
MAPPGATTETVHYRSIHARFVDTPCANPRYGEDGELPIVKADDARAMAYLREKYGEGAAAEVARLYSEVIKDGVMVPDAGALRRTPPCSSHAARDHSLLALIHSRLPLLIFRHGPQSREGRWAGEK